MFAQLAGCLFQFLDFENLAAEEAWPAGFTGDFKHVMGRETVRIESAYSPRGGAGCKPRRK
jgi:hypothetical protein